MSLQGASVPVNGRESAREVSLRLVLGLAGDVSPTADELALTERLREEDSDSLHARCIETLVGRRPALDFAEQEWQALLAHRAELEAVLGRSVGLQAAALDFFFEARPGAPEVVLVPHEAFETMRQEARIDPTTGLFASATFAWALEHEVRRARRYHRHIVFIMVDVDDMQGLIARRGADYGDFTLREVAGLIARNIRNTDTAGRIEADVFGIILHECRLNDGRNLAERLRAAVESQSFSPTEGDEGAHITISVAVVGYPESGDGGDKLMARARALIARAKDEGRNRVEAAETPP
jgi:diguanylate cyclase (GGDEF)-like protein